VLPATTPNPPFADDPIPDPPPSSGGSGGNTGSDTGADRPVVVPGDGSSDVTADYTLPTGDSSLGAGFTNNLEGISQTAKKSADGVVTISLKGTVTSNEHLVETWFGAKGGSAPAGNYAIATINGIFNADAIAYGRTLKNTNESWHWYKGFNNASNDIISDSKLTEAATGKPHAWLGADPSEAFVWKKIPGPITDDELTVILWSGATNKKATLEIVPLKTDKATLNESAKYTVIVDWSGLTIKSVDTLVNALGGYSNVTVVDNEVTVTGSGVEITNTAEIPADVILKVDAAATLEIKDSAKIEVASGGTLDLSTLVGGSVTLKGTGSQIEVSGTLKLPAPATGEENKYEVTQIDYGTSSITINAGGSVYMKSTDNPSDPDGDYYIGADGSGAKYKWDASPTPASSVEFKADGEMALTGNLTSAADNAINTKVTINEGAKLTVKDGTTLTVGSTGELVVEETGSVVVEGKGGELTLAPSSTGKLNGTITVKSGGVITDLNAGGGALWGAASTGSITIEAGGTANTSVAGVKQVSPTLGDEPATGVFFELKTGKFTYSRTEYILEASSTATLHGRATLNGMNVTIRDNSTLTLNISWHTEGNDDAASKSLWINNGSVVKGEGANAKIEIEAGWIIINTDTGNTGDNGVYNFYKNDGTTKDGAYYTASSKRRVEIKSGNYTWDGTIGEGEGGWKAEAEEEESA
jgi:hypothetical protein